MPADATAPGDALFCAVTGWADADAEFDVGVGSLTPAPDLGRQPA
jgi:hypothetical protein